MDVLERPRWTMFRSRKEVLYCHVFEMILIFIRRFLV